MGFALWLRAWLQLLLYMSPSVYSSIRIAVSIDISVLRASCVIFCEALAIYGVIVAIILQSQSSSRFVRAGYSIFTSGVIVGCANLLCGTVYAKILPTETSIDGTEIADDDDGGSAVKWETWNAVAVRVEGQPLASNYTFWGTIGGGATMRKNAWF